MSHYNSFGHILVTGAHLIHNIFIKGTAMQTEKALINDRLRVSKLS